MSGGAGSILVEGLKALVDAPEASAPFAGRMLGIFGTRLPSGNSGSAPIALFAASPDWDLVTTHHEGYVFEFVVDRIEAIAAAVEAKSTKGVLRDREAMTGIVPATPRLAFGNRDPDRMWHRAQPLDEGPGFMVRLPPFRDAEARLEVGIRLLEMASVHTIRIPGRRSGAEWMPVLEPKLEAYARSERDVGFIGIAVPDRKSFAEILASGCVWRMEPMARLYAT